MYLALIRFVHLFMAAVVLLSSTGIGLVEHTCPVRGKRVFSVYSTEQAGCRVCHLHQQNHREAAAVDRTSCCQTDTTYQHVETGSGLNQLVAKFVKSLVTLPLASMGATLSGLFGGLAGYVDTDTTFTYAAPPLLAGRMLLVIVQSFLI
jgi:hypothetical protein